VIKAELKICVIEEEPSHSIPYLETYEWGDGTSSQLPACCIYGEIGIDEFPSSFKRLLEINLTNNLTQMVSGIYSSELIEVDSDIFFVSFYDIDEAPTGCYFIKGSIEDALGEYLKYTEHLGIPFLELFKALKLNLSRESGLMQGWMAANTFTKNEVLEGLQIRLTTTGLNPNLQDLINNVELDQDKLDLWQIETLETPS
jgi:hypothetical protein